MENEIKIEISKRHYNGDVGPRSVFIDKFTFIKTQYTCEITGTKTFCINETMNKAAINITIPITINNEALTNLITQITNNNDYKYNETKYEKEAFDINKYKYIDLLINNTNYELDNTKDQTTINNTIESLINQNTKIN